MFEAIEVSKRPKTQKPLFSLTKKSNTRRHLTPIGDDYTKVNGRRNKSSVQSERFYGLIFTVEVVVLKSDDDVLKKAAFTSWPSEVSVANSIIIEVNFNWIMTVELLVMIMTKMATLVC